MCNNVVRLVFDIEIIVTILINCFRSDGTCAVGDLGLAVRYSGETNELDVPHTARVGTVRQVSTLTEQYISANECQIS